MQNPTNKKVDLSDFPELQEGIHPLALIRVKSRLFKANRFSGLDLFSKQETAMGLLMDNLTNELLYGGAAGGGKSYLGCEWLLWMCITFPGTRWFIGRKHLNEIRKSTVVTFRKVCRKHGIPSDWWTYNDNSVKITFENGSVIEGLELMYKPGDPDYDNFGSTEYTGGWIEEAGAVPVIAYEVLQTRIGRHLNDYYGIRAKLLITCNPSRNWLYKTFYQPWKNGLLPVGMEFIQSFVTDNSKRESGYLERLERLKGQIRARLFLGDWDYDDDPLSLIEFDAILDLFTNDYIRPDQTRRYLVCDIALHGSDLFRVGVFYGDVLMEHFYMPKSGGKQIISKIKELQAKHQIRGSQVLYDADGVGGFIGNSGGFIQGAVAFHGNAQPLRRKIRKGHKKTEEVSEYANLKSQCGFMLAEMVNEGKLWAMAVRTEQDRELLTEELTQVKRNKGDSDGKKRLKDKKDVIVDLGRSPDFSDLFLMKMYFNIRESLLRAPHERQISSN